MNVQPTANNITVEIEQEYKEFLAKLELLRKEQDQLMKEYREKLEQRKLLRLKRAVKYKIVIYEI